LFIIIELHTSMFIASGELFVDEDVITVSAVGGASGGSSGGGQFHLAPGKIDERVHSILKQEKLDRVEMENSWKEDVREVQEEASRRTDSVSVILNLSLETKTV
jgi:hypothetical protein